MKLRSVTANKIKFNRKTHAHPPSICEANCKEAPKRSGGQSEVCPECVDGVVFGWGCKPEPPKFLSFQFQPCHERIQVDHLAVALEGVKYVKPWEAGAMA